MLQVFICFEDIFKDIVGKKKTTIAFNPVNNFYEFINFINMMFFYHIEFLSAFQNFENFKASQDLEMLKSLKALMVKVCKKGYMIRVYESFKVL